LRKTVAAVATALWAVLTRCDRQHGAQPATGRWLQRFI